ncbi:aspartate aminotransferase family protein [Nakamurella lactea]|uniref:aspartate aminotransferase family protein n=1 Tax=Nakamurella lactea TaxID=459515 RepID=UPI0004913D7D|nr:aspartate aminotransferase family protein [Nakamurella lactea]
MLIESWPASEAAWARAKKSLAGGVSTGMRASMKPHPLFFSSASGPRMTDLDGNTYLDHVLGWGPVILGHGHPGLTEAVASRISLGATYGAGHALEYEAAERVVAAIPGVERVLWSNTGSEANQVALRLARAATGRKRFAKMLGHYHGWSDTFLLGYRPDSAGSVESLGSAGQLDSALSDVSLVPFGDLDAAAAVLKNQESDIAAVFVEPVLCNSGVIAPPEGYLAGLRELCDATDTVLVFDEVITGFRLAYGGAVERYGVQPDLVVLAKAIAGGYPVSAIAGRASLLEQVTSGVVHAGTYNGNPVVLAATVATLEALGADGIYPAFEARGQELATGMRSAIAASGVLGAVNQIGPVVQVLFGTGDGSTLDQFFAGDQVFYDRLIVHLLRRGVFALPGGRWYLSTAHTADDVATTVQAFAEALSATVGDGPGPA